MANQIILKNIEFINFLSLMNTKIDLDSNITVLVGPNESGKSSFLKGVTRLDDMQTSENDLTISKKGTDEKPSLIFTFYIPEDSNLFKDSRYKSLKGLRTFKIKLSNSGTDIIKPTFIEIQSIERKFFKPRKFYKNDTDKPSTIGEQVINPDKFFFLEEYENLENFEQFKKDLDKSIKENFIFEYEETFEFSDKDKELVLDEMTKVIPKVHLYDDKDLILHDKVNIEYLISPEGDGKNSYKTEKNLLRLGGLDDNEFKILKNDDVSTRDRLKRVSDSVTRKLKQFWKQNPNIKIELSVSGNSFLNIDIEDKEGTTTPIMRSDGMKWYLSFFLNYMADINNKTLEGKILLFDEAGIRLHPAGQKDTLKVLEDIGKQNQIIYTTHSPFMINRQYPLRIRLIKKEKRSKLSEIENKPYGSGSHRGFEPVRTAIGVSLGDSLMLDNSNLIVEGITDEIIITSVSQYLSRIGKNCIDLNEMAVIHAGGNEHIKYLVMLTQKEKVNSVVLLDADTSGKSAKTKLLESELISERKIVLINDSIIGELATHYLEIEDLIDSNLLMVLVKEVYVNETYKFDDVSEGDLNGKPKLKFLKSKLENKTDNGDINKFQIAKKLSEKLITDMENNDLKYSTKFVKFELLFGLINARK